MHIWGFHKNETQRGIGAAEVLYAIETKEKRSRKREKKGNLQVAEKGHNIHGLQIPARQSRNYGTRGGWGDSS